MAKVPKDIVIDSAKEVDRKLAMVAATGRYKVDKQEDGIVVKR